MENKVKEQVRTQLKDIFKRVRINSVEPTNDRYNGCHHIVTYKVNVSVTSFLGKVERADVYLDYDMMLTDEEYKHELDWSNLY